MLIDAHSHLDKYGDDAIARVLEVIEREQILTMSVSVDPASFARAEAIADRSGLVVAGFGIHPSVAHEYVDSMAEVAALAGRSPFLGEIGLDFRFVTEEALYGPQRQVFSALLELARDQDKLVNVHCAGAEDDTYDLLRSHGTERAIIHWYSGPLGTLSRLIDGGFMFTIGVEVLHSEHIRDVARAVPSGQLLTETDNPGGLRWLTGESGQPRIITEVLGELARIRGTEEDELMATVHANLFGLLAQDPRLGEWLVSPGS